jgi:hypothetical protein
LHVVIANEYRRLGNSAGVLAMAGLFGADGVATVLMIRQEVGPGWDSGSVGRHAPGETDNRG